MLIGIAQLWAWRSPYWGVWAALVGWVLIYRFRILGGPSLGTGGEPNDIYVMSAVALTILLTLLQIADCTDWSRRPPTERSRVLRSQAFCMHGVLSGLAIGLCVVMLALLRPYQLAHLSDEALALTVLPTIRLLCNFVLLLLLAMGVVRHWLIGPAPSSDGGSVPPWAV
jgi:hypothetical protein